MDRKTIIAKIRKCLALAGSANEHEAAAALRQAQKLMELHRVSDTDVLAAEAAEANARSGAGSTPANWEGGLASMVSRTFGCKHFFKEGRPLGHWVFVGTGANAEIAQYAFEVLLRQLKKARAAFVKSECKRLVKASRLRRADLFCTSWVIAASVKVQDLVCEEREVAAIDAYVGQHYPTLHRLVCNDRNQGRNLREKDLSAVTAGMSAGLQAQLHRGVDGSAPASTPRIGCSA